MKLTTMDSGLNASKHVMLLAGLTAMLAGAPAFGTTVLRTLAYHQLTAFTNNGAVANNHSLAISADGRRIAFARADSRTYGAPTNLIYAVNFDGNELNLIDAYPGDSPQVEISADGSKVLSWQWRGPVRLVNADGSNPHQVIQVNGGYPDFRLSPDGTQVFFSNDRDFGTTPDTGTREPGLYVVNADGTGLREISGLTSFALFFGCTTAQMVPDGYFYGWNGGSPFGLSGDGLKLACFVWTPTNGYRLLGLSTAGTDLHELPLAPTPIWSFNQVGLSGDGGKVFYYFGYAPCCSSGEELGVINWDGSGRRVLLSNYSTNQTSGGYGVGTHIIQLSGDGSKLLFGDTSYLFNTDGSGRLELGWSARFAANNVLQWGFYRGVMDRNATHFAYLTPAGANDGGRLQIGSAELNPASLGLAPIITNPSATPAYIATNGPSPVFAFHPTPTNGLLPGGGAQAGILLDGIADPATWQGSSLHDDGSSGDTAKGDGIYSDNSGYYFYQPAIGSRTLRYKAELLAGDGKHHATAIDVAPFFVVAQAPTNPPPAIISITPSNAPSGSSVIITGTGFDPIATNNVILFGNVPAQVISVNPAGTQLIVLVPSDLPAGPVAVTVSSTGQTSGTSSFGGAYPYTSMLILKMLAGLDVYGTVGMTYRIDYLSDVTNTNSWTALTNITLPANPYFWVDVSSTNQPKRFYRSVRVP